uniref:Uncharacterized protein n=1 Tax=Caenorhabditis japonica TaxID=281687 RepID=A0A8R1IFJ5_CAEJA
MVWVFLPKVHDGCFVFGEIKTPNIAPFGNNFDAFLEGGRIGREQFQIVGERGHVHIGRKTVKARMCCEMFKGEKSGSIL